MPSHARMRVGAQDGALSDAELNAFQVRCFAAPLQPEELAGVKRVVADKMKEARRPGLPLLPLPLGCMAVETKD